ncbi:hypothetical protein [Stigmatella aurantiaca]|uniref:Conserved uncharacterized protein n=1 Tax=Stigmatella aurantiaca (strain DW4/3-1) TaxID=378806 RepID=Q09DY1_STIAD|nr:hypothetical protein [Stigmatella aurantiaca]ADO75180.1 conserved uncharacterized protein [Stigmatella aurantiaca DW4/3-1]EAU69955.1 probable signal peptide protein, putative [Stigmatella aurantiaca DW4/3-1]
MKRYGRTNLIWVCGLLALGSIGCGATEDALEPVADEPWGMSRAALTVYEQAALDTANHSAHCHLLGNFYWEIGNGAGLLYGISRGSGVSATTVMPIASASKWLYVGAYVQSRGYANLSTDEKKRLNFTSGYIDENTTLCGDAGTTVSDCYGPAYKNVSYRPLQNGRYFYNGGHMQKLALDDIGARKGTGVASVMDWINALLSTTLPESDSDVAVAGGFSGSAAHYRVFLMKLINNQYELSSKLAVDSVPAWQGGPNVSFTPWTVGQAYYGLGHWIEGEAVNGVWTLTGHSSPGAYGFYPWVNAARTQYMLLARSRQLGADGEGEKSRACAQTIRKAYELGVPQP